MNATGGNAANGGNGDNAYDAYLISNNTILGGSGGNGGNGGGGAGAGIGTRGANGGTGGTGGQRTGTTGQETTQYGVDGNAGSVGGTAGAMGELFKTDGITLNATGGSEGSNGTGGSRGKTASQHPGSNVYMASGGGGGAGGFGGAATGIGTGGPGGGGGGGDGSHGGLVGILRGGDNTITIDGCVFDGSFATANGTVHCGGFIGWPTSNIPVITNSLVKPSSVDADMLNSTFTRMPDGSEPTITNCYYVAADNLPADQGTQAYAYAYTTTPANLGNLVKDYGMVKAYENGIFYAGTYYAAPVITLLDNADNSMTISENDGQTADVVLQGRTLYKDGSWNTLCLPFGCAFEGSLLEDATIKTLANSPSSNTGFDAETGTLSLDFVDAYSIMPGVAYLVKWERAEDYEDDDAHNIVNPVFENVTISNEDPADQQTVSRDETVSFIGTYDAIAYTKATPTVLYLSAANTLYYPLSGATVGAFRAQFQLNGITAGSTAGLAPVRNFVLNFGDGEATGIVSVEDGRWRTRLTHGTRSTDASCKASPRSRESIYIKIRRLWSSEAARPSFYGYSVAVPPAQGLRQN